VTTAATQTDHTQGIGQHADEPRTHHPAPADAVASWDTVHRRGPGCLIWFTAFWA